jgi:hypothetical protein
MASNRASPLSSQKNGDDIPLRLRAIMARDENATNTHAPLPIRRSLKKGHVLEFSMKTAVKKTPLLERLLMIRES